MPWPRVSLPRSRKSSSTDVAGPIAWTFVTPSSNTSRSFTTADGFTRRSATKRPPKSRATMLLLQRPSRCQRNRGKSSAGQAVSNPLLSLCSSPSSLSSFSLPGAASPGGAALVEQAPRAVDQRYVRERLREVADEPPRGHVVLLGEQAHVVAEPDETLEERGGLAAAAHERPVVREPEAAGQEDT